MKKIKFNLLNFLILIPLALGAYLFYNYFHFTHIGEGFLISPEPVYPSAFFGGKNLSVISTEPVNFSFVPDRYNPSSVIVEVKKKTFAPDEDDVALLVDLSYADNIDNGIIRQAHYSYPLNTLALSGSQILEFDQPLVNAKGQKISMKMYLSSPVGTVDTILIDNNHYRIQYREEIKGVIQRTGKRFLSDGMFSDYYIGILIFLLMIFIFFCLFRVDELRPYKKLINKPKN